VIPGVCGRASRNTRESEGDGGRGEQMEAGKRRWRTRADSARSASVRDRQWVAEDGGPSEAQAKPGLDAGIPVDPEILALADAESKRARARRRA